MYACITTAHIDLIFSEHLEIKPKINTFLGIQHVIFVIINLLYKGISRYKAYFRMGRLPIIVFSTRLTFSNEVSVIGTPTISCDEFFIIVET